MNVRFSCIIGPFSFQTIGMTNVVLVLFIELVVCKITKRFAPEDDSFLDREPQNLSMKLSVSQMKLIVPHSPDLEEKPILQSSKMLQMSISSECAV